MKLKQAERRFNLTTHDYAQLAQWRYTVRRFLRFSEEAAAEAGLTSQYYQAMLVLRGSPESKRVTINDLAQQLLIKHNSAVGLVDRLVRKGLVTREGSKADRRKVELHLTDRGQAVMARLAAVHRRELQRIGPFLKKFSAELARRP